jgi:hypothetical protein
MHDLSANRPIGEASKFRPSVIGRPSTDGDANLHAGQNNFPISVLSIVCICGVLVSTVYLKLTDEIQSIEFPHGRF